MKRAPPGVLVRRLHRRRIGVVQGGSSSERRISIMTGRAVAGALRSWGLRARVIEARGNLEERLRKNGIDLAVLALHGSPGEDGTLQGLLEILGIPYTGSGVYASALAINKPAAKALFDREDIPTPQWAEVGRNGRLTEREWGRIGRSWVVKPSRQGSALGVTIVRRAAGRARALSKAWSFGGPALVEEYVPGTEITVGVLGSEALPVVEIVPAHGFYDYHSKYARGGSRHVVPARIPEVVRRRAQRIALRAFEALRCRGYGRVDAIVGRDGIPRVLEVNTIPGMTSVSLLPDAARAAGIAFNELVLRVIESSAVL